MSETPAPLSHTIRVTVRFGHSDLLAIAWHGHYVQWLEDARQSLGTAIGLGYEDLIKVKFAAPIVDLKLKYKRPAKYGDKLDVRASLIWQPVPKLVHQYEIRRAGDNELLTTAETTQVLLHPTGELALNFPPFLEAIREKWQAGEINPPQDPQTSWA
ncbi:MAG: acyl-CoA thioesterase [Planctomycetes bacterium]|nr:acyl-CoA thioesterase [Planctomycetota bacterium]